MDERLLLGLEPDKLQANNRVVNEKGQIVSDYTGGGLYVELSSGGVNENRISGTHINIYREGNTRADRVLIGEHKTETEPQKARLINIVNHILMKRQLKEFDIVLKVRVEATDEAGAREALKNVMFFGNRDALSDWEVSEIGEV